MNIIRYETPKEEVEALEGEVIFLAGPTVRGHQTHLQPSWRVAAIEEFKKQGFEGTLILPEFTSITESDKYRPDLPLWEYAGLKRADCILFWVPRTKELVGLTTNWELGYWMGRQKSKVIFGRPDDAYRIRYSDIMMKELWGEDGVDLEVLNTLEATVLASMGRAKIREMIGQSPQSKKVMIFGTKDQEDGGLMGTIAFEVPSSLNGYEAMFDWLMKKPKFLPMIIANSCKSAYNEEIREEVSLTADNLEQAYWTHGVHLDFTKNYQTDEGETEEYVYEFFLDVENVETHEL